jgi:hypothetical protein
VLGGLHLAACIWKLLFGNPFLEEYPFSETPATFRAQPLERQNFQAEDSLRFTHQVRAAHLSEPMSSPIDGQW